MSPRWKSLFPLVGALTLQMLLLASSAPATDAAPQIGKEDDSARRKMLQDMRVGPFRLDLGASLRLRHEYQSGFDVRRYEPGTTDHFLLARVMLDLNLRFDSERRVFLQLRDAHAPGTRLERSDFRRSNPVEDILDIRQAYFEWRKIGGTSLGLKFGRQQISYGDQRIFGPGLWGNTGRNAWDAAMLHLDTPRVWLDAWGGRPMRTGPSGGPTVRSGLRRHWWPTASLKDSLSGSTPFTRQNMTAGRTCRGNPERESCCRTHWDSRCRSRQDMGWTTGPP